MVPNFMKKDVLSPQIFEIVYLLYKFLVGYANMTSLISFDVNESFSGPTNSIT